MYTIGQVAEMFGLPVSTLRYYDKQGLFPGLERTSGIRRFGDTELEALRVIECLKKAGMEIKDIRLFMEWCAEGPSTYPKRKAMFEERKAHMESEIANMNRALDMLKFKCWYYEQAIQDGNEDRVKALIPDDLPEKSKRPTRTPTLDNAAQSQGAMARSRFRQTCKKKASEPEGPEAVIPVISLMASLYGDAETASGGTRRYQNASSEASSRCSHRHKRICARLPIDALPRARQTPHRGTPAHGLRGATNEAARKTRDSPNR